MVGFSYILFEVLKIICWLYRWKFGERFESKINPLLGPGSVQMPSLFLFNKD